jgi:TonB family protein
MLSSEQPVGRGVANRLTKVLVLTLCLAAISGSRPVLAVAQSSTPASALRFDIPPQPLFSALEAYASVTGVTISYDSGLARNGWSPGLKGDFTREAALLALLKGSGLDPVYEKATGVVLESQGRGGGGVTAEAGPVAATREAPSLTLGTIYVDAPAYVDRVNHQRYARLIESDVEQALRGVGHAKAERYRVGLRVWLRASGAVARCEIAESTGDPRLDRMISAALATLVIAEPPPPDMPEPVDVRIAARTRSAR